MSEERLNKINAGDAEVIRRIEEILGVELEQIERIESYKRGYVVDRDGALMGLGLRASDIDDEKLAEMGRILCGIASLMELDVAGNTLTDVSTLGGLTSLTKLYLHGNRVTDVSRLGSLTRLTELSLWGNQLTDVSALNSLASLKWLSLASNQLTDISALGMLASLIRLDLTGNQLTDVSSLGSLASLNQLELAHNQLTDASALSTLVSLVWLDLTNNQLTDISDLRALTNLRWLYLGANRLMDISVLGGLTGLTVLDLSRNQLTDVSVIGGLRELTKLDLSLNQLTDVSALGGLGRLCRLYLNRNELTDVSVLRGLKKLTVLGLSDNELTDVSVLAVLPELERLDLRRNQIREMGAGWFERGWKVYWEEEYEPRGLNVYGNPLEVPPVEIVKQGREAVLRYLREMQKGVRRRYEGKLIILGDGSVGKTCVSRALRGLPFEKQNRTEGVEVWPWRFAGTGGCGDEEGKITLNIWDFEGQEINHQSHQFFLTEGALYVLVINGRKPFEMKRAEYWLDTIGARAPGSRVILVASECERTVPSWPLDRLKEDYGRLLQGERWYFAVGCENGKGIGELAEEIRLAGCGLEVMGKEWPESYQKAEEMTGERGGKKAHVKRKELYEIFEKSGISSDGYELAAGELAKRGLITQFADKEELEDFVVLNPQWLTKGVSLVMENEQLKDDKGEISRRRMREVWEADYGGLYSAFHGCMKAFELCYDMEDESGCLVPLRFGDKRPVIPWSVETGEGFKERRVEYRLNMRAPYGLMSRFIVKTHHMIVKTDEMSKGVYWRNGVFLGRGEGLRRSESLCEFDEDERVLRITVRAAFPQNMVEQLHWVAEAVFGFFKGLEPERRYGCVKFEDSTEKRCEGIHAENEIVFALFQDKDVPCAKGWHNVNPRRLVYGFTSFGEKALTRKELQEELAKQPRWAEGLIRDVNSLMGSVDEIYGKALEIRTRQDELPAEIGQQVEMGLREYYKLLDELLDNREFNSAPGIVGIGLLNGGKLNPKNWFEQKYILTPYCEGEGAIHRCTDASVVFKMPREWWVKTGPKVAIGVRVLSMGLKILFAGLPMKVPAELYEGLKHEIALMKELAGMMKLEGGPESDVDESEGRFVRSKGAGMADLRDERGSDANRVARIQLARLLGEVAPDNYRARKWGSLRRVKMYDNSYRWLCEECVSEYE